MSWPANWWTEGVCYQIYPRSFADTTGDGVGDLRGIIDHLDYLSWLGVDAVWFNPITASPNVDFGYDVADFTGVEPTLGTLADVDELITQAAHRHIAVVLDIVPNHTSIAHPWFTQSRSSRDNPKRDWYVWADPAPDGGPPNNWLSNFGGPAWTLDATTGQFYLHNFYAGQPDLNWNNPEVAAEFERILRYWFDRGVAGFRIDVAHMLYKDEELRDNPPASDDDTWLDRLRGQVQLYNADRPEVHELYRRWRDIATEYEPSRAFVGEVFVPTVEQMVPYYGENDGLHVAFNIPFLLSRFEPDALRAVVEETERGLPEGATPVWTLGNHDVNRFPSRWCGDDAAKTRLALVMLFGLRGTLFLYYGDELGLGDTPVPEADRLDPMGRDSQRSPMPWTNEPGAGFTEPNVEPWICFGDLTVNVTDARRDPDSVLSLTRDLIGLRHAVPDLRTGAYATMTADGDLWAFTRGERVHVALNFSDDPASVDGVAGLVRISTDRPRGGQRVEGSLALGPWEAVITWLD